MSDWAEEKGEDIAFLHGVGPRVAEAIATALREAYQFGRTEMRDPEFPGSAFMAGYNEGYADGKAIGREEADAECANGVDYLL